MIKYSLVCDAKHGFEGWFRNSDDFESQRERKLVACPVCGSMKVEKGLMAPAVSTSRRKEKLVPSQIAETATANAASVQTKAPPAEGAATPAPQPNALLPTDVQQKEILETLRQVRTRIIENSENVGTDFASEARKIHFGESEERSIYGETTPKDAAELLDEGISVFPLPELPEDKN
ncbi:DUF1178 family protein [uncultured Roseibium sp.]|uniref:DUF1178 family protein n=1 Tax=uncultured Roseibium sp. TaxID=1936171 RepID=UPI0026381C33|nr:DUF1178 family protein [uncultured Roseibium sp.]